MKIQLGYHQQMRNQDRAPVTDKPSPLTESERCEARAIAERLAVEVTRLLGDVDARYRNASALARYLRIDRTGIQRLISAVVDVDERTLSQAPGPKAIRRIIDAYAGRDGDRAVILGLREAVRRFESFLARCGGHQRGYTDRLLVTQQADLGVSPPEEDAAAANHSGYEANLRMFDTACAFTGRWSDVQTQIAIIQPSESIPRACDVVRARGLIGHVQDVNAVALYFTHLFAPSDSSQSRYSPLRPARSGELPSFMLDEFCSEHWRVSSMVEGETLIQIAELETVGGNVPADIVLANTSIGGGRDPRFEAPPVEEIWVAVDFPVRRLILDVYLHAELARRCTHGADAHMLRVNDPGFPRQLHRRWMTRIGPPLSPTIIGSDLNAAESDAYARQRPLTETLFTAMQWDPEQFVGFRLEAEFPVWRTAMRIYFTFEQ